jgi:hypothetical protein
MMMSLGPGSILVNKLGRRFMHGGYTYNDFSYPFGFYDQRYPGFANKPPAWAIFDGLYAAVNTSAAVLGAAYPGGGACIGPSVTMGYRAGCHVAARRPR